MGLVTRMYLNIGEEEARKRFLKVYSPQNLEVEEIDFDDELIMTDGYIRTIS